jgi:hypothetical protein
LVEVQTELGAMTEAVLETAIAYASAYESGIIIHVSTGLSLHSSRMLILNC